MMQAPCARFTMFSTPQTRARPSAITAYSPPSRMPLMKTCAKRSITGVRRRTESARVPKRHRIFRLLDKTLGAVDRCHSAVLNLNHDLRELDLAVRVECDRPIKTVELDAGECVAHFLRLGAAGLFDGFNQS